MKSYDYAVTAPVGLSKDGKRRHLLISTLICLGTVLLFLVFRASMPAMVPLQLQAGGVGGNHIPRNALVFGFPVVLALVNLYRGFFLTKAKGVKANSFYLIPAAAVLLAITTIVFALVLL